MNVPFRRSYEVVGFTADGAAYCVPCWGTPLDPDDTPVFLDQCEDLTCDDCHEPLAA